MEKEPRHELVKRRKGQIRATNIFATWPKNNTKKEDVMNNLKDLFTTTLDYLIVCEEQHKDKEPHLHAFISLQTSGIRTKFWKLDNCAGGKPGNYKPARRKAASVKYCMKEGNYCSFGFDPKMFVAAASKKKSTKSAIVAQRILDGASTWSLMTDPETMGYVLEKSDKIKKFRTLVAQHSCLKTLHNFFIPSVNPMHNYQDHQIACWLTKNIKKPRKLSQKQLWIYGDTEKGKSTFIDNLSKMLKVYTVDNNCAFLEEYEDGLYDLVVFDEFCGSKTISWMNRFCDGSKSRFDVKCASVLKTVNVPIIVLSNFSIDSCYSKVKESKPRQLAALKRRFVELCVIDKIDLYYTVDWNNIPTSLTVDDEGRIDREFSEHSEHSNELYNTKEKQMDEQDDDTSTSPREYLQHNDDTDDSEETDISEDSDNTKKDSPVKKRKLLRQSAVVLERIPNPANMDNNTFTTYVNSKSNNKNTL